MNLYQANLSQTQLVIGSQTVSLPDSVFAARPRLASYSERTVTIGIRPEHLPSADGENGNRPTLEGTVDMVEALGSDALVYFRIDAQRVHSEAAHSAELEELESGELDISGVGVARVDPATPLHVGSRARFSLDPTRLHFFDPDTGETIWN
jgi:multiple sugar transport system ATP-binding protein